MGPAVGVRALAALLALAAAGCASGGGGGAAAPPESVSGTFALVRIDGRLQPLERGAPECDPGGSGGEVELSRERRFELEVRQGGSCPGAVRRELSGTYVRRGEHLGFEARLPDGARVRFHGTTNDTTVVVRLSGAEIVFQRAGR